jgi:hypothetical protein
MRRCETLAGFFLVLAVGLVLLLSGRSAMAIEEPAYTVVTRYEDFEVRRYGPCIVAETLVDADLEEAGNQAFGILAGYIFGKNKGGGRISMTAPVVQTPVKIAMTAPVVQTAASSGMSVQFIMPSSWTLETLPQPLDSRVKLREVPERTVAVISYSGFWTEARYREYLDKLVTALAREKLAWTGEPLWARYNPPLMPWFLRRNEIWLELKP